MCWWWSCRTVLQHNVTEGWITLIVLIDFIVLMENFHLLQPFTIRPQGFSNYDAAKILVWMTRPTLISIYRCPRRNGQNYGRVFLMLNYTDITQNTYIQSWTVMEIMAIEKCGLLGCPRTVRRPWCHTRPLRMPGNETPLANIVIQWPWRDNRSAAACVKYLET